MTVRDEVRQAVSPGVGVVPVVAAVAAGVGLALQARLNGDLGALAGDGITGTLASTAVGLLLLLAVVPLVPSGRRGLGRIRTALRDKGLRWWQLSGGLCGALFVAGQGISAAPLGVAVFTVAAVGGTAVGGLLVDRFWPGPSGSRPITVARAVGAMACVGAVAIAGGGAWTGDATVVLVVLPVVAGVAIAVQSSLNGHVGAVAGSPWPATLLNFVVATAALGLALVLRVALTGSSVGQLPGEPLLYLAGVIGVGVIAVATLVVRRIGVLLFGLAGVAGQLLGALVLDMITTGPPSAATLTGVVITFVALVLAAR
ncbi:DMT family transporter [Allokutzneria sp. NRRL B-24872]|uniref:DMT family transporter n=1 Tax=Allokutzneria sp. NRRL B-24872 TaxID=1137961 RepID=UPI001FEE69A7|nr:DMT family transporter [Allokutzneria sp. NRRL B-24872]